MNVNRSVPHWQASRQWHTSGQSPRRRRTVGLQPTGVCHRLQPVGRVGEEFREPASAGLLDRSSDIAGREWLETKAKAG